MNLVLLFALFSTYAGDWDDKKIEKMEIVEEVVETLDENSIEDLAFEICSNQLCKRKINKDSNFCQYCGFVQNAERKCAICFESLKLETTDCGHSFCTKCLSLWKKEKNLCPICRSSLKSQRIELIKESFKALLADDIQEVVNRVRELPANPSGRRLQQLYWPTVNRGIRHRWVPTQRAVAIELEGEVTPLPGSGQRITPGSSEDRSTHLLNNNDLIRLASPEDKFLFLRGEITVEELSDRIRTSLGPHTLSTAGASQLHLTQTADQNLRNSEIENYFNLDSSIGIGEHRDEQSEDVALVESLDLGTSGANLENDREVEGN